ncbi:hypothetical protein BDP27DRAFT_1313957 [Rhodocollybia butyracea]|uniref:Uncharacterized protein n=1 Tax=Rhodocollybia butyracea TaxID=206335 RepID=A0A9P5Q7L8_9AGAR|nr:hypothetical protein BDP27DRAFT_1313957 [Rhodocollybia butyracea]
MNGFNHLELQQQQQNVQPNVQHGIHLNNFSSTSSAPFPEYSQHTNGNANINPPIRQGQSQSPFNPVNQWTAAQQSQQSYPHMLPQQLNQWSNPMLPPQQFLNGMHAVMNSMPSNMPNNMPNMPMNMNMNMPGFNMFPQQMLHDALSLSTPVSGTDDDRLLIDTLVDARARKDNFKSALNSLHAKNGHSASLWKDYYLEHKDRIDAHVSLSMQQKGITEPPPAVKPSPPSSPLPVLPSKRKVSNHRQKASSSLSNTSNSLTTGRRSTINSITAPSPSYSSRLPPPNAEVKIPEPPSRTPSPPTKLIFRGRGYKFTEEDKEFCIKFIQWRLKDDPSLTRNALCDQLAQKAPHHTSLSWASWWSNNHDLPDKILAAARGEGALQDEENSEEESSEEETKPRRRPTYKEESSSEDDAHEIAPYDDDDDDDVLTELSDNDFTLPSFDESAMGAATGPYTSADLALTARYVASFENFANASYGAKWQPWSERYPQRSAKAWAEYYKRNEREIVALAKKIKIAGAAKGLSPRPKLESAESTGPPKSKRKRPDDQELSDTENRSKIGKIKNRI